MAKGRDEILGGLDGSYYRGNNNELGWPEENSSGIKIVTAVNNVLQRWFWIPIGVLIISAVQFIIWASDRKPPIEIVSYTAISVKSNSTVAFDIDVKRDLYRQCSADYTRYLFDSSGYRRDLEGTRHISAEWIAQLQKISPNKLRLSIPLPPEMPIGRSTLLISAQYKCNPIHEVWPIQVLLEIPFFIEN